MQNRYLITSFFTVALLFLCFPLSAQNLMQNPGFETGEASPWFRDGSGNVNITTEAAVGNYAALGNVVQSVNLQADTMYELRCKTRIVSNAETEKVWIGIRSADGLVTNSRLTELDWEDMFIEFTAPSTGSFDFWIWGQGTSVYSSDAWELLVKGTEGDTIVEPDPPFAGTPASHLDAPWGVNAKFSDEFNSGTINQAKWDNDVGDWGTWSWEPDNAYITDTVLTLRMEQKTHTRNGQDFYFTSGINRHREKITYGYFETSIKATDKGQGTSPAFWLYSQGEPTPTEEGGVQYCEIDAIEIFQVQNQLQRLEMNLHTRIIQNGELTWIRPGQGDEELTHNTWVAPWDPRDEFHTYGVWNRVDSIFWYVDGIQRGAKKNHYWHLPMYPIVSLGLRAPYERYINGVRTVIPYPDTSPEPGFPTEMYCDYVRTWDTDPQLYADRELYYGAEYTASETIDFDVRFFAGNDETVLAESFNGISCELQEVRADGSVVQSIPKNDVSVVGMESGKVTFQFSLDGLAPSEFLPSGHRYVLKPVFRTSLNDGEDVYLKEEVYPITILTTTAVNDASAMNNIQISSSLDGVSVRINGQLRDARIIVHDLSGRRVIQREVTTSSFTIDRSDFPITGVYVVSVLAGKHHRVERVVVRAR